MASNSTSTSSPRDKSSTSLSSSTTSASSPLLTTSRVSSTTTSTTSLPSSSSSTNTDTTSAPLTSSSSPPPTTLTTSSTTLPKTSTSTLPSTTTTTDPALTTTTSSDLPITTTSITPTSSSPDAPQESTQVYTTSGVTVTTIITQTKTQSGSTPTSTGPPGTSGAAINPSSSSASPGLGNGGKIAVATVVPIAAVALLVAFGIFLWRRHKQRKDAAEERRKEVEEYGYNPNADPPGRDVPGTLEVKEDTTSGYRGWGSTPFTGSMGRKTSTNRSGGAGATTSEGHSPTRPNYQEGEGRMDSGSFSPDRETLGAMGPPAAENRSANVRRGPSNASSSYSAAARSDCSGDGPIGVGHGADPVHYNQFGGGNPYVDGPTNNRPAPPDVTSPPVIRDVAALRNTRIENPPNFPTQSSGISQNF